MESPDSGDANNFAAGISQNGAAPSAEERAIASRLGRLTLLYEVGRSLASMVRIDELLTGIVTAAADVMQARASSLMLIDPDGQNLTFEVAFGEKGSALKGFRIPINDTSVAGRVVISGEPQIVQDVRAVPFFSGQVDHTIEFETRNLLGVPLHGRGGTIGVIEVLNKINGEHFSDDDVSLLTALAGSAAVAIENARLYEETARRAAQLAEMVGELQRTYRATMHALSALLDTRDASTQGHSQRVVHFTLAVARAFGITDREQLQVIRYGALLHDVGKIGVSDAVLRKPGKLTDEEWIEMRKHPEIGYRMLRDIDFLRQALPVVLHHHEHWDGSGYPHKLIGEGIPLEARLFAIADVFDALTSERPYKRAMSYQEAAAQILAERGTHFDPQVVDAFLAIPEEEWQRLRNLVASNDQVVEELLT
ncbi:MAG TPA: HD domain-containing phosphohydrolase [Chloroflexia bacterium]|nr:HD domain-containing phosphohydrolase [Chloroflexia bacterium]